MVDSRDIIGDYPAFLDPTPPQSQPSHAFLSPTELAIREVLDPNEPPQEEILKRIQEEKIREANEKQSRELREFLRRESERGEEDKQSDRTLTDPRPSIQEAVPIPEVESQEGLGFMNVA